MMELVELLNKAGINHKVYARGPLGAETFFISLDQGRNTLRYWIPNLDNLRIENTFFSKKHNQICFSVVEDTRKIEREVKNVRSWDKGVFNNWTLRSAFGVNLPNTAKYTILSKKKNDRINIYSDDVEYYDLKIRAVVPKSTMHFLVGKDENNLFISQLPKAPSSVEDAHRILRPDGVSANAKRQGEWFFVKSDIDEAILNKKYEDRVRKNRHEGLSDFMGLGGNPWFNQANHLASERVAIKNVNYVRGSIVDTTGRHESLFLPSWHKVVRNNEIQNSTMNASWD